MAADGCRLDSCGDRRRQKRRAFQCAKSSQRRWAGIVRCLREVQAEERQGGHGFIAYRVLFLEPVESERLP